MKDFIIIVFNMPPLSLLPSPIDAMVSSHFSAVDRLALSERHTSM